MIDVPFDICDSHDLSTCWQEKYIFFTIIVKSFILILIRLGSREMA